MRKLCLFMALFACNQHKPTDSQDIKELYDAKLSDVHWADGWPSKSDCDATLWAGVACMAGVGTNLSLVESSPGKIERRPGPACYPLESKSEISRDMLAGYMGCAYSKGDVNALERLADYGESHNWAMGSPSSAVFEVYLDPNSQGLLARLLQSLGGSVRPYRDISPVYLPVTADYARHIQTINILVNGKERGKIDDLMLEVLKNNLRSNPDDALFQAAVGRYTGDFDKAIELLSNPNYTYPSYVRGSEEYKRAHWLFSASVVLGK